MREMMKSASHAVHKEMAGETEQYVNMVFAKMGWQCASVTFDLKSVDYADLGISTLMKSFCWSFLSIFQTICYRN